MAHIQGVPFHFAPPNQMPGLHLNQITNPLQATAIFMSATGSSCPCAVFLFAASVDPLNWWVPRATTGRKHDYYKGRALKSLHRTKRSKFSELPEAAAADAALISDSLSCLLSPGKILPDGLGFRLRKILVYRTLQL